MQKRKISLKDVEEMSKILRRNKVYTVCEEARCPNIGICFKNHNTTFMILGNICTRDCKFCNVKKGTPLKVDKEEPVSIARTVNELKLSYVVITSVTRDDLEDGGSEQFRKVIYQIRKLNPNTKIEILIPDFKGDLRKLKKVIDAKPDVISHNLETVPRLYKEIRSKADYKTSLGVLKKIKKENNKIFLKTGLMLGMGEKKEEVVEVFNEIKDICDILTLGQYFPPSKESYPLKEELNEEIFLNWKRLGEKMGIKLILAGPFVRSSFKAKECYNILKNE